MLSLLLQWRSIGVSNFNVKEIQILVASAKIKPVVNQVRFPSLSASISSLNQKLFFPQILFHPYVYAQQAPILEIGAAHNIVTEAYSSLTYIRLNVIPV